VHEHHARKLHWDLRLELDGVLKSFAVPKPIPQMPGVKRLAIEVEDHDLSYIDFEGEIKEGYGKGTVKIWDSGYFNLLKRETNKIEIQFLGEKLKGRYIILKIKDKFGKGEKENKWILFKI